MSKNSKDDMYRKYKDYFEYYLEKNTWEEGCLKNIKEMAKYDGGMAEVKAILGRGLGLANRSMLIQHRTRKNEVTFLDKSLKIPDDWDAV